MVIIYVQLAVLKTYCLTTNKIECPWQEPWSYHIG